jgi:pilus assembly protein TadC
MIKKYVVQFGELIINVLVCLGLLGVLISSIGAMSYSFMAGLMMLIGGVAGVVLVAFVVYILIDIRDQLKQLNNK